MNQSIHPKRPYAGRDYVVTIESISSDGEWLREDVNRQDFEVPRNWQPVDVHGIYGEYRFCGSEVSAQDHVSWRILVSRAAS